MAVSLLPHHNSVAPNYEGYAVIGAGLPRTGTMTMQAALEKLLKGPCYHMITLYEGRNKEIDHWENMLNDNLTDEDWKDFLHGRGFRA